MVNATSAVRLLRIVVVFCTNVIVVVKAQPPGGGGRPGGGVGGGGRPGGGGQPGVGAGGSPGGGGGGGGGGQQQQGGAGGGAAQVEEEETCSSSASANFFGNPNSQFINQRPSQGRCMSNWRNGQTKLYPDDFQSIHNEVEIYECPLTQRRIIKSNGIPDHNVNLMNNGGACEYNYLVNLPLFPNITTTEEKTEIPLRGSIAMAINGVPTYGPHEANSFNAVEGPNAAGGAAFWYGHAGNTRWHFHNPHMGKENVTSDDLLGYALDGFPIYGPLNGTTPEEIDDILDECNGLVDSTTGRYRYHVRTKQQINETLDYCTADGSPITNWNYILGCYSGSIDDTQITDSTTFTIPDDCVLVIGGDNDDEVGQSDVTQKKLPQKQEQQTVTTSQQEEGQSGGGGGGGDQSSKKRRPNIIVMQPDDFQWFDAWGRPPNNPNEPNHEILFPDNDGRGLPHLERLRTEGLQMLQAYTASPVCGTSRYSTITGKYPSRAISSRDRNANLDEDEPSVVTIPTTKLKGSDCSEENLAVAFSNAGYRTGMIGKWHLSRFDRTDYDYDEAVNAIQGCGFDFVDGLYIENLNRNGGFDGDGSFSHNMEWITSVAIDFFHGEQDDDDRPFFLYFNPTVPHGSADVQTALEDYPCVNTAAGTLDSDPIIKGMTEEHGGSCRDYRDTVLDRATTEEDLGPIWLDDSVGALLQALEDMNILDDTIFLFQNDHGMETKSALYENGIRIPQFIHYPNGGLTGGLKFDAPVATVDIGPTLLDFAGVTTLPYPMDGISWKSAIISSYNNETKTTSGIISEDIETNWKMNRCLFFEIENDRAVRCGCYKLLHLYDDGNSGTVQRGERNGYSTQEENLFDLCGGTDFEYVSDMSMNQEQDGFNLIDSGDLEQTASFLSDALECHLTRTNIEMDPPDYNQRCGTEDLVFVEGLSGGDGSDECVDSDSVICPAVNSDNREMLCNASAIAEACPLTCGLCSL